MNTLSATSTRPTTVSTSGRLRLTRRGRLVVFLSCLALACAVLVAVAGTALGNGEAGDAVPTRTVTVQPGDTLWGIAQRAAPEQDPREVIEQIEDLNRLGGSLQVGEKLALPLRP